MNKWVIVRKTRDDRWLRLVNDRFSWTRDINEALHFDTKEEAAEAESIYTGKYNLKKVRYWVDA